VGDEAFHAADARHGDDRPALRRAFTVSESLTALRIAECIGYPTAWITPRRTRNADTKISRSP